MMRKEIPAGPWSLGHQVFIAPWLEAGTPSFPESLSYLFHQFHATSRFKFGKSTTVTTPIQFKTVL